MLRFAILACSCAFLAAGDIPSELKPFVVSGMRYRDHVTGDLNKDGRSDALLVLENQPDPAGPSDPFRALLILVRQKDGRLKGVKRNDKAVFSGDWFGKLYNGLTIKGTTFTVSNASEFNNGGASDRFSNACTFGYSRRDQTWQLIRVVDETFDAVEPERVKRKVHTPPKHFGKIDFAEFDPSDYLGKGPK